MPHRVTSFFRNSSSSLENQVSNLKRATAAARRTSSPGGSSNRSSTATRASERSFSYASSTDEADADEAHNRPVMSAAVLASRVVGMDGHGGHHEHSGHRLSFSGLHFGRSSKESHTNPHATIDWKIESPPVVLYGDADNSSGALVSGQIFLRVKEDGFQLESFKASLKIHVTQKRPFAAHCYDCANQFTDIEKWTFLQSPPPLSKGEHAFPFSVLLGGQLPARSECHLMSIAYEFKAEAIPRPGFGAPITLDKPLDVKRALPASELPHHSVRVFPPTNIKASVYFPQVIHPVGQNTLALRIDGIARINSKASAIEYWRLKKLIWRLEETTTTVAPACEKHTPKDPKDAAAPQNPPPKKGVQRADTRAIGEKTMFSGWKSSYGGADSSSIEMEIEYALAKHAKFTCDMKSRDGSQVTHQLMLEMVVSQEWAPINKPALVTQTGVGRILRMHFATVLTERAGIGISWDNEAPPIYQDVPPSPPAYSHEIGEGTIMEHLESLDAQFEGGGGGSGEERRPGSAQTE